MTKKKKTILWIVAAILFLSFVVYFPHIASWLFLIAALLLTPSTQLSSIRDGVFGNYKRWAYPTIVIVVLLLAIFSAPTSNENTTSSGVQTQLSASETTGQIETTTPTPTVTMKQSPSTAPTANETTTVTTSGPDTPLVQQTPSANNTVVAQTEAPTEPTPTSEPEAAENDYVLNTNTMKFHWPWCRSVENIKDENKETRHCTKESLIAEGYEPCKICNP